MRILRGLLVLVIFALSFLASGSHASAKTLTASDKIKVQARVLPAHTIVINDNGEIIQIASNTTEDVTEPNVYANSIDAANEQTLTPEVYARYQELVPPGTSQIGILYERSVFTDFLQLSNSLLYTPQSTLLIALS